MGILSNKEKLQNMTAKDPRQIFYSALKQSSGAAYSRNVKFDLFYNVYAFKGVVEGVGCSTLVANTAVAIAQAGVTVCVIDTSVLSPVQDILLKTSEAVTSHAVDEEHLDWFDMPYTRKSVLHVSKINTNVSVLSFRGKQRGIVDVLSTSDSALLVDMALTELHSKFDIILIDCCHELTEVNTACLQQAQRVIQVWSDAPSVVGCLEGFITNSITLSSPMDKMRNVVCSKMCRDIMGGVDELLKQYKLNCVAKSYMSEEVYLQIVSGKCIWGCVSSDKDITAYNDCIADIACLILNIKPEEIETDNSELQKSDVKKGEKDTSEEIEVVDTQEQVVEDIEVEDGEPVVEGSENSETDDFASSVVDVSADNNEKSEISESPVAGDAPEPVKKKGFFGKKK